MVHYFVGEMLNFHASEPESTTFARIAELLNSREFEIGVNNMDLPKCIREVKVQDK